MATEMTSQEFLAKYCETQENTPAALRVTLMAQKQRFNPDGFMLLECQMLDSSRLGSRVILPYGPNNTFKTVPDHPISPRGLASDTSVVIGILKADQL